MTKLTNEELVQAARADFGSYAALVHETDMVERFSGRAAPAEHHELMIDALCGRRDHTLIVAPRGAAKSSIAQWWVEWSLGKASLSGDPTWPVSFRVLWLSHAATEAYDVSLAIKETIEANELFQIIFPDVKPYKDKWAETEWRIQGNERQKHPTFKAGGIDSPPLGSRASIIVFDDVADEDNMATPLQRQKIIKKIENTVKPMLVPTGRFVMLCTRWAWDDPADWAMKQGWHTIYMKALQEVKDEVEEDNVGSIGTDAGEAGGRVSNQYRSYWPDRFPVAWLLEERAKSPRAFARQYQNEVAPDEGLVFQREWFEPRFDYLPAEVRLVINSWDTAAGEGRNRSYSAGWSAVLTPDWHLYLWKLKRGQVPYPFLKQGIRDMADEDRADYVIIEKKSSGHQVIQEFAYENHRWQVVEWQPFGQKGSPTRLSANEEISDFCQQGRVHLPSEYFVRKTGGDPAWLSAAEDEIFSYPDGQSDDIVDAMCQMLYWVKMQENAAVARRLTTAPQTHWAQPTGTKVLV